jgi:hypothetical protein
MPSSSFLPNETRAASRKQTPEPDLRTGEIIQENEYHLWKACFIFGAGLCYPNA